MSAFQVDVIRPVGTDYWMMAVMCLFMLLYMIWISIVVMVQRDARLFAVLRPARARRPAKRPPR
jgi:hypothetical protein